MNVSIGSYGQYSSGNYGVNAMRVDVGMLTLFFSYQTPVAFRTYNSGLVVRENEWGPTTGKHLNWLDSGRSNRISGEDFENKLQEVLKEHDLQI